VNYISSSAVQVSTWVKWPNGRVERHIFTDKEQVKAWQAEQFPRPLISFSYLKATGQPVDHRNEF
jgi:hypothetical protein